MTNKRWLTSIAVVLAVMTATARGDAATIRDRARLFSPAAVERADEKLKQIERMTHIPVVIETIDAIPGLERTSTKAEREEAINALALKRDREIHDEGLYILISKREHLISNLLVRQRYATLLPLEKRDAIRNAFLSEFQKKQNYDGGLEKAVHTIEQCLLKAEADVPAPLVRRNVGGRNVGGGELDHVYIFTDSRGDLRSSSGPETRWRALRPPGSRLPWTDGWHGNEPPWHGPRSGLLRRCGLRRTRRRVFLRPLGRPRRRTGRQLALRSDVRTARTHDFR